MTVLWVGCPVGVTEYFQSWILFRRGVAQSVARGSFEITKDALDALPMAWPRLLHVIREHAHGHCTPRARANWRLLTTMRASISTWALGRSSSWTSRLAAATRSDGEVVDSNHPHVWACSAAGAKPPPVPFRAAGG